MRWVNNTKTTQLVYDNVWNPFYVKVGGIIDDSKISTEKLVATFLPLKRKPIIGILTNKYKHSFILPLLKQITEFDFIEIPVLHEKSPEATLRNKYLNNVDIDIIIALEDGNVNKNIINLCQLLHIKVIFLVSELNQHLVTQNIYSDFVVTYGDISKENFEKVTKKEVVTANYLQMRLGNKLTKQEREQNKQIAVVDKTNVNQSAIKAVKDVYSIIKDWDISSVFDYSFNSPQLAHINKIDIDLSKMSVVVGTPSFYTLRAALLNIPVVVLNYKNETNFNLHFNITDKIQIVSTIRKAMKANKEDLKKQKLSLNKLCNINKTNILTQILSELINAEK